MMASGYSNIELLAQQAQHGRRGKHCRFITGPTGSEAANTTHSAVMGWIDAL